MSCYNRLLIAHLLLLCATLARAAPAPLDAPLGRFPVDVMRTERRAGDDETELRFPSVAPSPSGEASVRLLLNVPHGAKPGAPGVLILSTEREPHASLERRVLDRLLSEGFVVLRLLPRRASFPDIAPPPPEVIADYVTWSLRNDMLHARRAAQALAERPEVDPRRLAVYAAEIDVAAAAAALATEPLVGAGVFVDGGLDYACILGGTDPRSRRAAAPGLKPEHLRKARWHALAVSDFPPEAAAKPALVIRASARSTIPAACVDLLRKGFPSAREERLPDPAAIAASAALPGRVAQFLSSTWKIAPGSGKVRR